MWPDQALYAAKHGGRNRTVCHGEVPRAKDEPPLALAAAGVEEGARPVTWLNAIWQAAV